MVPFYYKFKAGFSIRLEKRYENAGCVYCRAVNSNPLKTEESYILPVWPLLVIVSNIETYYAFFSPIPGMIVRFNQKAVFACVSKRGTLYRGLLSRIYII